MKLVASASPVAAALPAHVHGGEENDGLEWEDLMPDINRRMDPSNMIWKLIDRESGGENHAIQWRFSVGDRVKTQLVNEMEGSDHPMHHPFHIHGAGRFLILSRDGRLEPKSRLEGHCATSSGRDRGNPSLRDESRAVDGSLPYRRTHRERDDVQLLRRFVRASRGIGR